METVLKPFLNPQRIRSLVRQGFDLQDLPQWTNKLIYSSYFEKISPTLGYRGKIKENNEYKHQAFEDTVDGSRFTNIPVSLRFLSPDLNSSLDANQPKGLDSKSEENGFPVQFPYRLVRNAFNKDSERAKIFPKSVETRDKGSGSESSDWFQDYGTPDISIPPTNIPCGGCGALLHCHDAAIPGYIPSERMKIMKKEELRAELCQRCYFFSFHDTALKVNVSQEDYFNILSQIRDKRVLVLLVVDLLDFPCSLWSGVDEIIGTRNPVILVGNKVDLLPRDSTNYVHHLKNCLESTGREVGLRNVNLIHTALVSATTGFGIESLIDRIFSEWGFKGDIYIMGCMNVGKSSLFNAFLQSDLCKIQVVDLIQRATISPWPGTTLNLLKFPVTRPASWRIIERKKRLAEDRRSLMALHAQRDHYLRQTRNPAYATLVGHIGRTFVSEKKLEDAEKLSQVKDIFHVNPFSKNTNAEIPKKGVWDPEDPGFINGKWCFDTPGVVTENQILDQLTLKELMLTLPKEVIVPRTYLIYPDMSLFVGGLARVDYKGGGRNLRLIVFTSHHLPINIVKTEDAEEVYGKGVGGPIFGIPFGDATRLKEFPPLRGKEFTVNGTSQIICAADIVISSAGWIGLSISKGQTVKLEVFTPNGTGIFCRTPSFLPNVIGLKGKKLRGSLSYTTPKPFLGPYRFRVD